MESKRFSLPNGSVEYTYKNNPENWEWRKVNDRTNKSILLNVNALSIGEGEFHPTSYTDKTRLLESYVGVVHAETDEIRRWAK